MCSTPWLTTRRRTCPICKGDVVRSMAHASSTGTTTPTSPFSTEVHPHDTDTNNDIQTQVAETVNDNPSAAIPIPQTGTDLERGDDLAATLVNDQPEGSTPRNGGWRSLAAMSLSAFTGEAAWREAQAERERERGRNR